MLNRKMNDLMTRRSNKESGFTLIELLVVMIIIGILAAIAIPAFMNQQKGARDTQTTSDVKNIATNVHTGLVRFPDATYFAVTDDDVTAAPATGGTSAAPVTAVDTDGNGKVKVWVGNSNATNSHEIFTVTVSKGTNISIGSDTAGTFILKGWNTSGKNYTESANARTYNSNDGGLK